MQPVGQFLGAGKKVCLCCLNSGKSAQAGIVGGVVLGAGVAAGVTANVKVKKGRVHGGAGREERDPGSGEGKGKGLEQRVATSAAEQEGTSRHATLSRIAKGAAAGAARRTAWPEAEEDGLPVADGAGGLLADHTSPIRRADALLRQLREKELAKDIDDGVQSNDSTDSLQEPDAPPTSPSSRQGHRVTDNRSGSMLSSKNIRHIVNKPSNVTPFPQ